MYLERLLPENVRHLPAVEQVFSDGPEQIRRWTLLSAGVDATARLRCLALASLGRWQMSRLIEEMLERGLDVNFNQTLDLRLLTPETAALLRRLPCANASFTRRNLYFSLNDTRHFDTLFLYNARPRMGRFVARLEALCRRSPGGGDSFAAEGAEGT